ncbi:uncharacterized protein VTP21DRAFT_7225 [Calcarisporiella thermophila]|uniref:uncharacterized protein n=1 Tax=Calcarisporiella thermophila TaxID=911321 RepID=UPI0037444982
MESVSLQSPYYTPVHPTFYTGLPPPPLQHQHQHQHPHPQHPQHSLQSPTFAADPKINSPRPAGQKRHQVKNACVNCQKACKKCDDGRPCQRCIKYGLTDTCVNSPRKERKKGIKRGPYKRRNKKGKEGEEGERKEAAGLKAEPSAGYEAFANGYTPAANVTYDALPTWVEQGEEGSKLNMLSQLATQLHTTTGMNRHPPQAQPQHHSRMNDGFHYDTPNSLPSLSPVEMPAATAYEHPTSYAPASYDHPYTPASYTNTPRSGSPNYASPHHQPLTKLSRQQPQQQQQQQQQPQPQPHHQQLHPSHLNPQHPPPHPQPMYGRMGEEFSSFFPSSFQTSGAPSNYLFSYDRVTEQ